MSQQVIAPQALPPVAAPSGWKSWLSLDNRFVPPVFITLILLVGHLSFGILESYPKTLLAIAASMAAELILGRIFLRQVAAPGERLHHRHQRRHPGAIACLLAVCAVQPDLHHVEIRAARERSPHLEPVQSSASPFCSFWPAIRLRASAFSGATSSAPMLVIWALGAAIIWRLRRFHITGTYVVSFLVFAFLRAWITGNPWQSEISPITGPEYQLFIFFMITDPKTTVRSKTGQCIVAFCVALVEMLLRLNQVVYAPFYALFLVGPTALLIEMWMQSRRQKALRCGCMSET